VDLVVISVLLDAGAGDGWTYTEAATGLRLTRSEGLAVASLRMAEAGAFGGPLRVSAATLEAFDDATLAAGFQITRENPLAGAEGRVALLRSLGRALAARPDLFGPDGRPGSLIDTLAPGDAGRITGPRLLHALLDGFGSIWPGRLTLGGVALGDVWHHPLLGPADSTDGLVPFHKLSQWLAYSLVEPLAEGGVEVTALHELTGLPEYRNGGLFVDGGVLEARDPASHGRVHAMSSELVVSWRALTVALLDRIHPLVAERLGHTVQSFPMGCLLEGGTWLTGRRMAQRRRPGGGSPFLLATDGTVF
jgi:hypothetical protein